MIKIFKYLKPKEWLMAGMGLIFIVVQVWLDLKLPDFMSEVTKLTQTPDSAMSDIWLNGGYMLLCALGSLAAAEGFEPPWACAQTVFKFLPPHGG